MTELSVLQRIQDASQNIFGHDYFADLDRFNEYVEDVEAHLCANSAPEVRINTSDGWLSWDGDRRIMLGGRPFSDHKHPVRHRMRKDLDFLLEEIASVMEAISRQERNQ